MIKSIIKIFPLSFKKFLKDSFQFVKRIFPGRHVGLPKYGLEPTQIYPFGKNLLPVMLQATKSKLMDLRLNPSTPVASIGSCFAEEIAFYMINRNFNYLRKEDDLMNASANWGRVFTIPNLLQIIQYSADNSFPLLIKHSEYGWFDPLREDKSFYKTEKIAQEAILRHRKASLDAFESCEILIITVGQNEGWVDKSSSLIWAKKPPKLILENNEDNFSCEEFSYEKNLSDLNETIRYLKKINKGIKILFTVSPVPSQASFLDIDVVTKSFANKALLRTVVNKIVSTNNNVYYFPSFEMVLCDNPKNYKADNRHVKHSMVRKIFNILSKSTFEK